MKALMPSGPAFLEALACLMSRCISSSVGGGRSGMLGMLVMCLSRMLCVVEGTV